MPTNQALQVFYGTIPLILVLAAIFFREQLTLKDILARLGKIEVSLASIDKRVAVLETRAGIVYQG